MITYNMLWYWSSVDRTRAKAEESRKTSEQLIHAWAEQEECEKCVCRGRWGHRLGRDWGDPPDGSSWESEAHSGLEDLGDGGSHRLSRRFLFPYGNLELVKNSGQKVPRSMQAGGTGPLGWVDLGLRWERELRKQDGGGCCSGGRDINQCQNVAIEKVKKKDWTDILGKSQTSLCAQNINGPWDHGLHPPLTCGWRTWCRLPKVLEEIRDLVSLPFWNSEIIYFCFPIPIYQMVYDKVQLYVNWIIIFTYNNK